MVFVLVAAMGTSLFAHEREKPHQIIKIQAPRQIIVFTPQQQREQAHWQWDIAAKILSYDSGMFTQIEYSGYDVVEVVYGGDEYPKSLFDLLAKLPRLRFLGFQAGYDCSFDDEGLSNVSNIPQIEELLAYGSKITDSGLEVLAKLPNLRALNLNGDGLIGDAGVEHLLRLPKLESLSLDFSEITDAGLKKLSQIKQLRHLSLFRAPISDESVDSLINMPHLESLCIDRTKMTKQGIGQLIKAKPKLVFTHPQYSLPSFLENVTVTVDSPVSLKQKIQAIKSDPSSQ